MSFELYFCFLFEFNFILVSSILFHLTLFYLTLLF